MDTRNGNVVSNDEMLRAIEGGSSKPSDFVPLEKIPDAEIDPKDRPAFKPKAGCILEFTKDIEARVEHVGALFMTCKMKGKDKLSPEMIGQSLTLGDTDWKVITTGNIFRLQKRIVFCNCRFCESKIFEDERHFKNKDGSYSCARCIHQIITDKVKLKADTRALDKGLKSAKDKLKALKKGGK